MNLHIKMSANQLQKFVQFIEVKDTLTQAQRDACIYILFIYILPFRINHGMLWYQNADINLTNIKESESRVLQMQHLHQMGRVGTSI